MFEKDIEKIENHLISLMKKKYLRNNISKNSLILLNKGRFANAAVFRYKDNELDLTIKSFFASPWLVRNTLGKIFIKIESETIKKLKNNPSVTKSIKKLSPYTLAFSFIEGEPLKRLPKNSIPVDFFINLEKNVKEMHKQNIVHLDLRNLGNIIAGKDKYPYIIDFQSCISTKYLPKKIKKFLEKVDISGVYKCWKNSCIVPLNSNQEKFLKEFNKKRKFWILSGYPILKLTKKLKIFKEVKIKYDKKKIISFIKSDRL